MLRVPPRRGPAEVAVFERLLDMSVLDRMFLAGLVSTLAALGLGWPIRRLGLALGVMDKPSHRSSHFVPVPRTGGIAIVLGALLGILLFGKPNLPLLTAGGLGALVLGIGMADDIYPLPPLVRLLVQLAVAGCVIGFVGLEPTDLGLPYLRVPMNLWGGAAVSVLFAVGFVNFFNFMDGINGLGACQGLWGALSLGVLLLWGGAENSALVAASMAGGCLGFLPHNFPRARMFMGDVGSTSIGFCLAMLTLVGGSRTRLPWIAFVLPLGVFLYDAAFTLVKRALRRENILQAHREHHYQLLIRSGWSHVRVTLLQAAMMTMFCAGAALYAWGGDLLRLLVLLTLAAAMAAYSYFTHRTFARHGTPLR